MEKIPPDRDGHFPAYEQPALFAGRSGILHRPRRQHFAMRPRGLTGDHRGGAGQCAHTVSGTAALRAGREFRRVCCPPTPTGSLLGAGDGATSSGRTSTRRRPQPPHRGRLRCAGLLGLDAVGMALRRRLLVAFPCTALHRRRPARAGGGRSPSPSIRTRRLRHRRSRPGRECSACDGQRALGTGGDAAWSFSVADVGRGRGALAQTADRPSAHLGLSRGGEVAQQRRAAGDGMCGRRFGRAHVTRLTDRMSASIGNCPTTRNRRRATGSSAGRIQ